MGNCRILVNIIIVTIFTHLNLISFAQEYQNIISNPKFDNVRAEILKHVQEGEIPSMSVAVAQNGKIIWMESFGWANREKMIKATPNTMYSMASISKPIATTGLMVLLDRGLVKLDDPVNKYIAPEKLTAFEGESSHTSIRHILNHTSGLPTHYTCFYLDETNRQPPSYLDSIRRYGILVHPPGAMYQYANFGFGLVGHIIEKVSNTSFSQFMKTEVFLPLGMNHTSINIGPGLEKVAAERYHTDGNPVPFYISDHPGASQVYCSAHDLIHFGMFHLKNLSGSQKQILKPKTIDLMQKDSDPNPENNRYGLGWFLREDEFGYNVVWHTGSMRGVNTMLKMVSSENIAVVVLLNTTSRLRNKIPNDLLGVLLPKFEEGWKKFQDRHQPERKPFKPTPQLIGEWKGEIKTYEEAVPICFIFQEDGDVHVKIDKQMETFLNNVRFNQSNLTGRFYGTIPSGDAKQFPHDISCKLILKENFLSGYVTTNFKTSRSYGNFSSYIYLKKDKE